MNKMNNLAIAIDRCSSAIKYLTWAMQETDEKMKIDWLLEAKMFNEMSIEWLEKELPF